MFGSPLAFTVPDLDRTDHLVIIGANPLVSNGSLATAADFPGKLKALRKRGGTAHRHRSGPHPHSRTRRPPHRAAARHGRRAVVRGRARVVRRGPRRTLGGLAEHVIGVDEVRDLASSFSPEAVAAHCGVAADDIRALARDIAAAPSAAVYGRIGTSTVEFGTTRQLARRRHQRPDRQPGPPGWGHVPAVPGGFGTATTPKPGRGWRTGRWHSRVSGHPEALSELPAAALAEEIDTAGEGQIKAMVTIAGNPVLSAPDGDRLSRALEGVDFMVSVDPYLNETTRHADVILPPPPSVAERATSTSR